MKTPLAWRNVSHRKGRSIVALCGISFAILLIFMQLGFYAAAATSATNVYEALAFDVLVLSPQYTFLARPNAFLRNRLEQVRAMPGVASITPLWIEIGEWRSVASGERWNILTLGVDPADRPFRAEAINRQLPMLKVPDTALSDSLSRLEHGPLDAGITSELQHHRIRIVGRYTIGAGFVAGATLVTGRDTFLDVFKDASPDRISAGLVTLVPGPSPQTAALELRQRLWPVATALTRSELSDREQGFWLRIKPIGIIFTSGVLVAFAAGAVVLYQVLAAEAQHRLREYATLKAIGYRDRYVYGVVVRQAIIFSGLGFVPAFFLAHVLYFLLRTRAQVPVTMGVERVAGVFGLTAVMCLGATLVAVRKLREADPADLF